MQVFVFFVTFYFTMAMMCGFSELFSRHSFDRAFGLDDAVVMAFTVVVSFWGWVVLLRAWAQ